MSFLARIFQPFSGRPECNSELIPAPDRFRITFSHVSKVFCHSKQWIVALHDVSLEILDGEFTAIVGRSGSGKTSLLNILAGFEPATEGEVRVFGQDPRCLWTPPGAGRSSRNIGYVPQKRALSPHLSVFLNVESGPGLGASSSCASRRQALEALELLHITKIADRLPGEITASERFKVSVARAIAPDPRVILVDQIGATADLETTNEVLAVLKRLNERGKIVVITTCDHGFTGHAITTWQLSHGRLRRRVAEAGRFAGGQAEQYGSRKEPFFNV